MQHIHCIQTHNVGTYVCQCTSLLTFFLISIPTGSSSSLPPLPVNPLLVPPVSSVPFLALPLGNLQVEQSQVSAPMVIVAEGIPPIQTKLIEKIRCWEYVDLSKLLGGSDPVPEEASMVVEGHICITNGNSSERPKEAAVSK